MFEEEFQTALLLVGDVSCVFLSIKIHLYRLIQIPSIELDNTNEYKFSMYLKIYWDGISYYNFKETTEIK